MSVMKELQKHAGTSGDEGASAPSFGKFGDQSSNVKMQQMMEAQPIPGQSLTRDPEDKAPWETPPEYTDVTEFIEDAFLELSDPERLPLLLEALRGNIPVEHAAEKFLMKAFQEGKITMDLLMLAIEPVIYTIISLATYAKIDPVLYPQDDMDDSKVPDEIAELRRKSKDLMVEDKDDSGGITVQEMEAPATAPKSLLARSKKAVEGLS